MTKFFTSKRVSFQVALVALLAFLGTAAAAGHYRVQNSTDWTFYGGWAFVEHSEAISTNGNGFQFLYEVGTGRGEPWDPTADVCDYDSRVWIDSSYSPYHDVTIHWPRRYGCSYTAWFSRWVDEYFHDGTRIKGYWKDTLTGGSWRYISRTTL